MNWAHISGHFSTFNTLNKYILSLLYLYIIAPLQRLTSLAQCTLHVYIESFSSWLVTDTYINIILHNMTRANFDYLHKDKTQSLDKMNGLCLSLGLIQIQEHQRIKKSAITPQSNHLSQCTSHPVRIKVFMNRGLDTYRSKVNTKHCLILKVFPLFDLKPDILRYFHCLRPCCDKAEGR